LFLPQAKFAALFLSASLEISRNLLGWQLKPVGDRVASLRHDCIVDRVEFWDCGFGSNRPQAYREEMDEERDRGEGVDSCSDGVG